MGLGGKTVFPLGTGGGLQTAIDPKTGGKIAWRHALYGGAGGGLLTRQLPAVSRRRFPAPGPVFRL